MVPSLVSSTMRTRSLFPLSLFLLILALGAAACGDDEEIAAEAGGAPTDESLPPDDSAADDGAADDSAADDSAVDDGVARTRTQSRDDLIQLEPAGDVDVIVDADDRTLLVRWEGAAEPCSGTNVAVEESDTEVIVTVQHGFDPNIAAMSCIAAVFDYEIVVPLDGPVGDRTLTIVS